MKSLSILFWILAICNGLFGQTPTPFDKRKADADACMARKEYDCAIQNYKTCLAIRADAYCQTQLKKATDEKEFDRIKGIADGCFRSKKFDCAIQNYNSCLAIRPDNYCQVRKVEAESEQTFYRNQAKADRYMKNEDYDNAIVYYQKCLALRADTYAKSQKLKAENEIAFRNNKSKARRLLEQENYDQAITYLNKCLEFKADEECESMLEKAKALKVKIAAKKELQTAIDFFVGNKKKRAFQILSKYLQQLKTCNLNIDEATCSTLQLYVGYMYDTGEGVRSENNKEAITWYKLSAKMDNPNANHNLGTMYEKGEGVTVNLPKARDYYKKAIQLGYNSEAQLKRVLRKIKENQ